MRSPKPEADQISSFGFAKKLARNLIKKSSVSGPPVILDAIFKSLPIKIRVEGQDLGREDGFSVGTEKIIFNSTQSKSRARFTVAHELGHILMGHNTGERTISYQTRDPNEQLANVFAAEVLTPLSFLKKETFALSTLSGLSSRYWVSKTMLIWRLRNEGLDLTLGDWN